MFKIIQLGSCQAGIWNWAVRSPSLHLNCFHSPCLFSSDHTINPMPVHNDEVIRGNLESVEEWLRPFIDFRQDQLLLYYLIKSLQQFCVVVQLLSHVQLCDAMDCSTRGFPCPSLSPRVGSNSCPLSWWYWLCERCNILTSLCRWGNRGRAVKWIIQGYGQAVRREMRAHFSPRLVSREMLLDNKLSHLWEAKQPCVYTGKQK